MTIVADTSAFLAVVMNEPERARIVEVTTGQAVAAPSVLPFELGNALTAMLKRGALQVQDVGPLWDAIQEIPVELWDVDMPAALDLASRHGIYAYDAYFLECAVALRAPILTLDGGMKYVARRLEIEVLE